jgi:hypothetical protein
MRVAPGRLVRCHSEFIPLVYPCLNWKSMRGFTISLPAEREPGATSRERRAIAQSRKTRRHNYVKVSSSARRGIDGGWQFRTARQHRASTAERVRYKQEGSGGPKAKRHKTAEKGGINVPQAITSGGLLHAEELFLFRASNIDDTGVIRTCCQLATCSVELIPRISF